MVKDCFFIGIPLMLAYSCHNSVSADTASAMKHF